MALGYQLIADSGALTSAVTQYDFTGLDFSSDDALMLNFDVDNGAGSACSYYLTVNAVDTVANYYHQELYAYSSVKGGGRSNNPVCLYVNSGYSGQLISMCKLTESGYFTSQNSGLSDYGSNQPSISNRNITTTFTLSSISQLSIIATATNGIGVGSRIKLYKLIAEPLADIIVTSDTTQVDITDLNLDETNELLLVSDIQNGTASSANIELFFNNDTTSTSYYKQELSADSSTVSGARTNDAIITRLDATNGDTVCMTNIKLTNSGYPTAQGKSIREVGTSGVNLINDYLSKTGTVTSITDISLVASVTGAIGTGSRFKLYKLK